MNSRIKLRLLALLAGVGLMGAAIAIITLNSQRQANELRARLSQVDLESFGIADHFKEALRAVVDRMRRYRTDHDSASWDEFLKASSDLDAWIDLQAPKLTTERERSVLKQLDAAYDAYVSAAKEVHDHMQATNAQPAELDPELIAANRRLADLGQDLAKAHYESRNVLLAHVDKTLAQLRLSVLGSLGLMFLFGFALALSTFRDLIAPLRVKLVESQMLMQRHEKLASLGLLAAGVAHEIRNPLTAIKGSLFMQRKRLQPGTPEQSEAELIEKEILRLERIVNGFLQFARPADPEMVNLLADQPLREVQALLAPQLAKTEIQLTREDCSPMRIKADPRQIQQVLINLVQNSADSIGRRGTIRLRARGERRQLPNGSRDAVILEVIDTGKGMSAQVQERLFDPFFTIKDGGTGLGLSIAARIVENHGGVLQYQTQINRGTTFGVVLPQATK